MSGVHLRNAGQSSAFSPKIKRSTHILSDGTAAMVVFDLNSASGIGDDTTGTAKIYVYKSTTTARTAWTLHQTITPAVAHSTSTRSAVASSCIRADNSIYIVYAGTDESLRFLSVPYSAGSYGAATAQTIVAADAGVTNKYRAVDIDADNNTSGFDVAAYRASATSGVGASLSIYRRRNDGTTWVRAVNRSIFTSETILAGSEDVSIATDRGVSGTAGQPHRCAVYVTQAHSTGDKGDVVVEYTANVDNSVTDAGTVVVTWYSTMNQGIAGGQRRGWMFTEAAGSWVLGASIGTAIPQFQSVRLTHNVTSGLIVNQTNINSSSINGSYFEIQKSAVGAPPVWVAATFSSGRMVFAFAGRGVVNPFMARFVMIRYSTTFSAATAIAIDSVARPLDQGYYISGSMPVLLSGGSSYNCNTSLERNFAVAYSVPGTGIAVAQDVRAVVEDTPPSPTIISPLVNPGRWRPTVRFTERSATPYSDLSVRGQFQYALVSNFTGATTVTESDISSNYASLNTENGTTQPTRVKEIAVPVGSELSTNTYYFRARVISDQGVASAWSPTVFIELSHAPTAVTVAPKKGQTVRMGGLGTTLFQWKFSDTETEDSQSAYRVIVEVANTGATVLDTGKVISSALYASLQLTTTYRDVLLQWRVALWDTNDVQGAYSDPVPFVASDPATVLVTSPAAGSSISTTAPTVQWSFTASNNRTQVAYRVQIYTQSTGALRADSGWKASSATSHSFPTAALLNSTAYNIVVSVIDSAGMTSGSHLNTVGNPNFSVGIAEWANIVGTAIAWDSTIGKTASGVLKITPDGVTTAPVAASLITGPVVAGELYTATINVFSFAPGISSRVFVRWYNAAGGSIANVNGTPATLAANTWEVRTANFTAPALAAYGSVGHSYVGVPTTSQIVYVDDAELRHADVTTTVLVTAPTAPTTNVAAIAGNLGARITWTNATKDASFVAWRVYRRYQTVENSNLDADLTASTWVLVYETYADSSSYTYDDYQCPSGKSCSYVVVQAAERTGGIAESVYSGLVSVTVVNQNYLIIPAVAIGSIASYSMGQLKADSFGPEVEREEMIIPGRGRVIQVGEDLGYRGKFSLTLEGSTGRADREFYEYLARQGVAVYIKTPFGDVIKASIYDVSAERTPGRGSVDAAQLSVSYAELMP